MSTILRQSWLISVKDTRIFIRDRFALGFALLFPLIFVIGFSFGLAGVGPSNDRVEFTIVTLEADGGISHQIIESSDRGSRLVRPDSALSRCHPSRRGRQSKRLPRLPRRFHQQRDGRPADRA